jgi:hypothetical protein
MKTTLEKLYNSCINAENPKNTEICGSIPIHRLLIFDNNGSEHKNIFDSNKNTKEDFNNIINNKTLFIDDNINGGNKSRKKYIIKKTKTRTNKRTNKKTKNKKIIVRK